MSNKQMQMALKIVENKDEKEEKKEKKETKIEDSRNRLENIFNQLEDETVEMKEEYNGPKFTDELNEKYSEALKKKKKKKKKKESDFEVLSSEIETQKIQITKELPNNKLDSVEYQMVDTISNKITELTKELEHVYQNEKELKEKGKFKENLLKYEELLTQQMIKLDLIQGSEEVRIKKKEEIKKLHKLLDPLDEKIAKEK